MTSLHSVEVKTKSIWIKTSEDIETARFKKQVNKNLPTESSLREYHPCIIVQKVEAEIMGPITSSLEMARDNNLLTLFN